MSRSYCQTRLAGGSAPDAQVALRDQRRHLYGLLAGLVKGMRRHWWLLSTLDVRVVLRFRDAVLFHEPPFLRSDLLAADRADDRLGPSEEHTSCLQAGIVSRSDRGTGFWFRVKSCLASVDSETVAK